jgi:hypothetical protein
MTDIITTQNINLSSIINLVQNDTRCETETTSLIYSYIYNNTTLFTPAPSTWLRYLVNTVLKITR